MPIAARIAGALLCLIAASASGRTDQPAGHHTGYYYPLPQTMEIYESPVAPMADTNRLRRLAFVTGLSERLFKNPYPPPFAIFAKGDDAEQLIIISLNDSGYNTIYRARALLAELTAVARLTPVFREAKVDELSNFLDLCKMLGYTSLVWSDGRDLAHEITIQ